jgi:hypothetical protein
MRAEQRLDEFLAEVLVHPETGWKKQKLDDLLADILARVISDNDFWPSDTVLSGLNLTVLALAMTQRKKLLLPHWKAYELVNRRWPKIKLIKRVKELVAHARDRLKEANATELSRIRRDAFEGAPKAHELLEYLEAIQEGVNKAAQIDWQEYKELLFKLGNYRLACDQPAPELRRSGFSYSNVSMSEPSRERCYTRALEILAEDLRYEPLRDKALSLLVWMVISQVPDYYGVLKSSRMGGLIIFDRRMDADIAERLRKKEQRAKNLARQRLHRLRKIFTSRERAVLASVMYHKAPSEFRERSEADFVRRFSR